MVTLLQEILKKPSRVYSLSKNQNKPNSDRTPSLTSSSSASILTTSTHSDDSYNPRRIRSISNQIREEEGTQSSSVEWEFCQFRPTGGVDPLFDLTDDPFRGPIVVSGGRNGVGEGMSRREEERASISSSGGSIHSFESIEGGRKKYRREGGNENYDERVKSRKLNIFKTGVSRRYSDLPLSNSEHGISTSRRYSSPSSTVLQPVISPYSETASRSLTRSAAVDLSRSVSSFMLSAEMSPIGGVMQNTLDTGRRQGSSGGASIRDMIGLEEVQEVDEPVVFEGDVRDLVDSAAVPLVSRQPHSTSASPSSDPSTLLVDSRSIPQLQRATSPTPQIHLTRTTSDQLTMGILGDVELNGDGEPYAAAVQTPSSPLSAASPVLASAIILKRVTDIPLVSSHSAALSTVRPTSSPPTSRQNPRLWIETTMREMRQESEEENTRRPVYRSKSLPLLSSTDPSLRSPAVGGEVVSGQKGGGAYLRNLLGRRWRSDSRDESRKAAIALGEPRTLRHQISSPLLSSPIPSSSLDLEFFNATSTLTLKARSVSIPSLRTASVCTSSSVYNLTATTFDMSPSRSSAPSSPPSSPPATTRTSMATSYRAESSRAESSISPSRSVPPSNACGVMKSFSISANHPLAQSTSIFTRFKRKSLPTSSVLSASSFLPARDLKYCSNTPRPKKLSAGEILVSVIAVAVDGEDIERVQEVVRSGNGYGMVLGRSFVGRVMEGSATSKLKKGQIIWGLLDGRKSGALAEFIVVSREQVSLIPKSHLTTEAFAALPLLSPAVQITRSISHLPRGSKVLLLSTHTALGSLLLEFIATLSLYIIAQAPQSLSPSSVLYSSALPTSLLLDSPINVMDSLHDSSIDVVVDCSGGRGQDDGGKRVKDAAKRCLHFGGTFITTSSSASSTITPPSSVKSKTGNGSGSGGKGKKSILYWNPVLDRRGESTRDILESLRTFIESSDAPSINRIQPVLSRIVELNQAGVAFERSDNNEVSVVKVFQ